MRLFSAIIVSGILLTSSVAWSIPRDEALQERNPIEWFLSDLGSLFRTAAEAIEQNTTIDSGSSSSIATQFSTDSDADFFGTANFDPVLSEDIPSNQSLNSAEPKQTISGLFETLLAFLNQNAQSDVIQTVTVENDIASLDFSENNAFAEPSQPKNEETADLAENNPPTSKRSDVDLLAVLEGAAEAYENDEGIESTQNTPPLHNDFFASLGIILKLS